MSRVIAMVVGMSMLASPVWSLSCLRPDVVRAFEQARDAEEAFWFLRGTLIFDDALGVPEPQPDGRYKDDASASTIVRFEGHALHLDGFRPMADRDITVTVRCLAHWCGVVMPDEKLFMAVELTENGPELTLDPCRSRAVPFSEEGEKRLLRCARDGMCLSGG